MQAIGPFGFFALIFAGVIWLTQSLRIIEIVVNNAQAAGVFIELSALLLPGVLTIVLPISAFAATIVAVNRLYTESELVVMMAVGKSRLALAKPILALGLVAMVATFALTAYLAPKAERQLSERTAAMQAEVANSVLQEGRFNFPVPGITVFVEQSTTAGEMAGVFIQDIRNPQQMVTYSADRARLVRDAMGPQMILFDGTIQTLDHDLQELSLLDFDQAGYNLDLEQENDVARIPDEKEFTLFEIFEEAVIWADIYPARARALYAHGHNQFASALYAFALPMLATVCILMGTYQRGGFGKRITISIVLAILIRMSGVLMTSQVEADPSLAPLIYMPPVLTIVISMVLLSTSRPMQRSGMATA